MVLDSTGKFNTVLERQWVTAQEYRRKYDLDTLVKEEEEVKDLTATARATVCNYLRVNCCLGSAFVETTAH